MGDRIWTFLTSVKVAAILTALLTAAIAVGTLLPMDASGDYIYRSPWFVGLIVLFCANLFCCAFKTVRSPSKFFGVFLMHTGIIVVVAGGAGTRYFGEVGEVSLVEGQRVGTYQTADRLEKSLGFELALEDFRLEYYPPRVLVRRPGGGDEETFQPEMQEPWEVLGGRFEITPLAYFPSYDLAEEVLEADPGPPPPSPPGRGVGGEGSQDPVTAAGVGIEVAVSIAGPPPRSETFWVFPEVPGRDRLASGDGTFELTAALAASPEEFETRTHPAAEGGGGERWIFVRIPDAGITRRFPAEAGSEQEVGGGYRLRVEEVVLDYRPGGPANPRAGANPAARVTVMGPRGDESRWVFARHPELSSVHANLYGNVEVIYQAPLPAPARMELVRSPAGEWAFVESREGRVVASRPLAAGDTLTLEGVPFQVAVQRIVPAAWVREVETSTDPRPTLPVLKVRIRGPDGEETLNVPAGHGWQPALGGALEISCDPDAGRVKEYLSTLVVFQGGHEVLRKTIQVNDPLAYGGFSFYQANFDPERPDWTGLQVVRDPGNTVVYVGFALLSFGLVYASFVRPLFSRKGGG